MLRLLLEELNLLFSPLIVIFSLLLDDSVDAFNLGLELDDFLLVLLFALLKFAALLLQLDFAVLSLQLLPHRERHRATEIGHNHATGTYLL